MPITTRSAEPDPYAQVAEKRKRDGLSPLNVACFIQGCVDAGESSATIASRL